MSRFVVKQFSFDEYCAEMKKNYNIPVETLYDNYRYLNGWNVFGKEICVEYVVSDRLVEFTLADNTEEPTKSLFIVPKSLVSTMSTEVSSAVKNILETP